MDPLDLVLNLDRHLNEWAAQLGGWLHALLFAIVFAETGLVVTPFLPGDSLLFAVGALAATPDSEVSLVTAGLVMSAAAVLGDAVNYSIGRALGPRVFTSTTSRLLNRNHLARAQAFYEKYGGKTIVIARFLPIIRTFAPFVAGVGRMHYPRFAFFNVAGGLLWVWSILLAGYAFGGIPVIKENFSLVVLAIIAISMVPIVIEWIRARRASQAAERAAAGAPPLRGAE